MSKPPCIPARYRHLWLALLVALFSVAGLRSPDAGAQAIAQVPLFLTEAIPPRVALVLSKDHEMFKEAYPDHSDLDGDGRIDNTYIDTFTYAGYFDAGKCYTHNGSRFQPATTATGPNSHHCSSQWSGNFLNWAAMTRMDIVRKVLYGGKRSTDTEALTVLERSLLPTSAHAFAKVYTGDDVNLLTPFTQTLTLCNVTFQTGGRSDTIDTATNPPLLRVAGGAWPVWAATEARQCAWRNEKANASPSSAHPDSGVHRLAELAVRVEVCTADRPESNCLTYPAGSRKPRGLLQRFGEDGRIEFGLFTGSYENNISGGVLRRNIGPFIGNTGDRSTENEVDSNTGIFINNGPGVASIINTIDRLRITQWEFTNHRFADNCGSAGITSIDNNQCTSWGNPVGEMMLEAMRYFSGESAPTTAFDIGTEDSRLAGLPHASDWRDPLDAQNFCASPNVVLLSSGVVTHDAGTAADFASASDVPGLGGAAGVNTATNRVGSGEGISGAFILGGNNAQCTAESISSLADAVGVCPEAGSLLGGYDVAGLSNFAWTNDLRPEHPRDQSVKTFAINLAEPLPRLRFGSIELLPTCQSRSSSSGPWNTCSAIQTDVLETTLDADGNLVAGRFRTFWEDSTFGSDYDMDGVADLDICMGSTCGSGLSDGEVRVTVDVVQANAGFNLRFGFLAIGTATDGLSAWVDRPGGQNFSVITNPEDKPDLQPEPQTTKLRPGTSDAGLLRDPLWYAAKWGGFDKSLGDTPALAEQWDTDGDGNPDNYFLVRNPSKLEENLNSVFTSISAQTGSASSISTNSTRLSADTIVYQARFISDDWTGELLAFTVSEEDGSVSTTPIWDAGQLLPPAASRRIFTTNSATGQPVPFLWNDLSDAQRSQLGNEANLDWLRGDRSDASLRQTRSRLGDIVNSNPAFSSTENFGFSRLPDPAGAAYATFLSTKSNRPPVIFVGANDGMLHAFHAETGEELFAYVPKAVFQNLAQLPRPDYVHQFFVDGTPRIFDARIDGVWRTLLVGSTGAGARSLFVLDITDPASFSADDVLWDITEADFPELGLTIPDPTIALMPDQQFWLIAGNGYSSAPDTSAQLLLFRVSDGESEVFDTGATDASRPNGLSSPAPVDIDGDRVTDRIYAGDLLGNLWRFDVDTQGSGDIGVDSVFSKGKTELPLFTARDSNDRIQPITARPLVGRHPESGLLVYFGTGAFFRVGDNLISGSDARHSFYAIRDREGNNTSPVADQSGLLEQSIVFEGTAFGQRVRVVGSERDETKTDGWRLDLISPVNGVEGERVVSEAILRFGRIVFTTLIPSPNPCEFGGSSWLMEVDAETGGNFERAVFDIDDDGLFNDGDSVNVGTEDNPILLPVSGLASEIGIISKPTIVSAGDVEYKYASGSSGEISVVKEISGGEELGRQSWRQIR